MRPYLHRGATSTVRSRRGTVDDGGGGWCPACRGESAGRTTWAQLLVQLTLARGTEPSRVAGLMAQVTVRTVVPAGCSTVMTADENARSSIVSVQWGLGQSGAPAMVRSGATVNTENGVVPFLTSLAGIAWLPITVSGAGFWPGAWLPPWLVQVAVTSAWAVSVTSTSPLPSPDSSPDAARDRPLSRKLGSALAPPL